MSGENNRDSRPISKTAVVEQLRTSITKVGTLPQDTKITVNTADEK